MLFSVLVYVCRLGGPSKIFFYKTNDDDDDDDDSVIVVEMQQPISWYDNTPTFQTIFGDT